MKKWFLLAVCAVLAACDALDAEWNDLLHAEVVANILIFEVEGQEDSSIDYSARTVSVLLPEGTDPSRLTIRRFLCTEGAKVRPALEEGSGIDLSKPLKVTLTTYDKYVWTVSATIKEGVPEPEEPPVVNGPDPEGPLTREGPQPYNMGFDLWSTDPATAAAVCYGDGATDEQKQVWGGAGAIVSVLGLPTVTPEYDFVAVAGAGKAALKLTSQWVADMCFFPGLLFNGQGDTDFTLASKYCWGIPFTARPAALEGYFCYKSKTIDKVQDPYKRRAGQQDKGHVIVLLTDWETPFDVTPPDALVDYAGDPAVIGYGRIVFEGESDSYERFQLNLVYRSDRTPKYLTVIASSSSLGEYCCGGTGSTLYLDELSFLYQQD